MRIMMKTHIRNHAKNHQQTINRPSLWPGARAEQAVPVGQQLQAITSAEALRCPTSTRLTTALRKGLILFIDEAS